MSPFVWRILRRLRRVGNGMRSRRCVRSLALSEYERARQLAAALQRTSQRLEDADEMAWVERVEAVREHLASSEELIEDVDFGSGSPGDAPTQEEMTAGRDDSITLGDQTRLSSLPENWCRLLFHLVKGYAPSNCLELGTSVGISACYQGAALKLAGGGRLVTLEGAAEMARRAKKNAGDLGLDNVEVVIGRFRDTLQGVLDKLDPIDWAFVDGHHDEVATVDYCSQIIPRMSEGGVLVLDDITWSPGMLRAWKTVSRRDDVAFAVDLHQIGVVGFGTAPDRPLRCRATL